MAEQNQAKQSIYEQARAAGAALREQGVQERSASRSELGQLKPANTPRQEAGNDNARQERSVGGRGM